MSKAPNHSNNAAILVVKHFHPKRGFLSLHLCFFHLRSFDQYCQLAIHLGGWLGMVEYPFSSGTISHLHSSRWFFGIREAAMTTMRDAEAPRLY